MEAATIKKNKKVFYRNAHWYVAFGLLIIVTGFFRSYFKQLGGTDIAHHIHGIAALMWMLLLIVQPFVFSTGNLKWHRWLGKFSFVVVPVVILSAFKIVQVMIQIKSTYPPLIPYQLAFIDMLSLVQFALFYVLAIFKRKQIQLHARYMVATVFIFVIPGLGRALLYIPGVTNFNISVNLTYILTELAVILLLVDDKRSGKIRLPYVLALSFFAVQHIGFNYVGGFAWWHSLMDAYAVIYVKN